MKATFRTSMWSAACMAAALAVPTICIAGDDDADPQNRGEIRSSISGRAQDTLATYEGKLVSLHEYMTSGRAATTVTTPRPGAADRDAARPGAQAGAAATATTTISAGQGLLALETSSGLIILSDPQMKVQAGAIGAADRPARPRVIEPGRRDPNAAGRADDDVAGADRAPQRDRAAQPGQARDPLADAEIDADSTVYGIPRADLDKANQRVRVTGTLYTKGGVRYLVVSSATAASAGAGGLQPQDRNATPDRNRPQPGDRDDQPGVDRDANQDDAPDR